MRIDCERTLETCSRMSRSSVSTEDFGQLYTMCWSGSRSPDSYRLTPAGVSPTSLATDLGESTLPGDREHVSQAVHRSRCSRASPVTEVDGR